jgi:DUF1680 family protein
LPRGIAAVPELAYSKNFDNGFSINLYSAGKLTDEIFSKDGKETGIECTVNTKFPEEGKVTIKLDPEIKTDFRLSLYVPLWCRNYIAFVNGINFYGIPGKYLEIEQMWEKNTIINISFDLPVQMLDGGKSYPGYIAIKYGPQVLAVDQALNPEIKDMDELSMASSDVKSISKTLLPDKWVGFQIFGASGFYKGKPVDLNLVPFADAGQTGGDIRVWIKKK